MLPARLPLIKSTDRCFDSSQVGMLVVVLSPPYDCSVYFCISLIPVRCRVCRYLVIILGCGDKCWPSCGPDPSPLTS